MKPKQYKRHIPLLLSLFLLLNITMAQKVKITPGGNLVLNNNVSLVLVNGAVINNGTVIPGSSSVYFRGNDSSALEGTAAISLNNLYVDKAATLPLTMSVPVSVSGTLSLVTGSSRVNTNNLLTLKSTAAGTARVSTIPAGGTINGKVTVERFIQAHRSWRLVAVPLQSTGSPTIKAAWQENAASAADNPTPGYGTHITGATAPENGFDFNQSRSASCKEYSGGSWTAIANTDVQQITDQPGYMLFVRGSRANVLSQGINAGADNTILRATGNLNIGNVTYPVAASGYTLIGNPYASPIDFSTVTRDAHVPNTFYVWDPLLTGSKGLGGYVTVSYDGSRYDITSSVSAVSQYIQSGTAFFVHSDGNNGSVTISESDKSDQSRINILRPAGMHGQVRTDLFVANTDSTLTLYDGVMIGFADEYNNGIDQYDAPKLNNGAENISIISNNKNLSIERRQTPLIHSDDTVFFSLSSMATKNYRLRFSAEGLAYTGAIGLLNDSYLGNQSVIDLAGITDIPFSVNANPGSYAANRFMLILKHTGVLANGFTGFSATEINKTVLLKWQLAEAVNIKNFEVQRSCNGLDFTTIAAANPGDFRQEGQYRWVDANAGNGISYYRIKAFSSSAESIYSKLVAIETGKHEAGISVLTNSIAGNSIILQMVQQPKGIYQLRLNNAMGQSVFTRELHHSTGNSTETVQVNQPLQAGVYFLEINTPLNSRIVIKLLK